MNPFKRRNQEAPLQVISRLLDACKLLGRTTEADRPIINALIATTINEYPDVMDACAAYLEACDPNLVPHHHRTISQLLERAQ